MNQLILTAYENLQKQINEVDKMNVNAMLANSIINNVAELKKRKVYEGNKVETYGYYSANDGGGAKYLISSTNFPWSIPLDNGLFANIINSEYVNYRMFGCKLDGVSDDGPGMRMAHAYCNTNHILLQNNDGILYKLDADEIEVKYDVDLSGTTILIDNENCNGWYRIVNEVDVYYSYENYVDKTELRQGSSYITNDDNAMPVNCVLHIKDNNPWATRNDKVVWNDDNSNITYQGTWSSTTNKNYKGGTGTFSKTAGSTAIFEFNGNGFEIYAHTNELRGIFKLYVDDVLVDTIDCYDTKGAYNNKVYSTTSLPVGDHVVKIVVTGEMNENASGATVLITQVAYINSYYEARGELAFHTSWGNFTGSLTYGYDKDDTDLYFKYSRYNSKRLYFKGCNLRIETSPNITIEFLVCTRHNTEIMNFICTPKNNATPNKQFHGSVIMVQDAYNVTVRNVIGANIAGSPRYPDRKNSGYVIRLLRTFRTNIEMCDIQGYWGCMGTACVKDLTIKDSTLNRIDVHNYFSEIFIQNVKIYDWGIDIGCGTGNLTFNNCKFVNLNKPNWGGQTMVNINNTYGYLFDGTIIFRDCEVVKDNLAFSLVKVNWTDDTGTPRARVKFPNIIIDNITIKSMQKATLPVSIFRFNGTSAYAEGDIKVIRPTVININNLYHMNTDDSYGSIRLLEDASTTDAQFDQTSAPDIKLSNIYSSESELTDISSTNKFLAGCTYRLDNVKMSIE